MNWDAVFFDFDGVIVDSVHIKTSAFSEIFSEYGPEVERQVVDYHLANGGISRYEKFKYYYKEILNKKLNENELVRLSNRFSELVIEKVLNADYIKGAESCLKNLHVNKVPLFVISGTPQDEIEYILEKRKLLNYFQEVHGSPRTKYEIAAGLLSRYHFTPRNCLFVGDAMSDYLAAKKSGVQFLGVVSSKACNPFPIETRISIGQLLI